MNATSRVIQHLADTIRQLDEISTSMAEARLKRDQLASVLKQRGPGVYNGYSVIRVKRTRIKAHWRRQHDRVQLH